MTATLIDVTPLGIDGSTFTFTRPQVAPGDRLYAIIVTSTPATLAPGGGAEWVEVAGASADQRIAVLVRTIDGTEPSLLAIPMDTLAVGGNAGVVLTVQGAGGGTHRLEFANFSDPTDAMRMPAISKSSPGDLAIGIATTNGSSEKMFLPSGVVSVANVRDAGFASIQLLVFETPTADATPLQVVTLANPQPGTAATLVIPAA